MLYLILLRYIRPLAEVDAHLAAHGAYLEAHYRAGHFLLSGRREPRAGGVILARGDSAEVVAAWAAADPFHRFGVADYEIVAFTPSLRGAPVPAELAPAARVVS